MRTLDEAIAHAREVSSRKFDDKVHCIRCSEFHKHLAEWLEELKVIKRIDLSIPQHFTKEQSDWIKAYCIKRNIDFYNKAIDDFVKFASDMPTVETEDGEIRPMWLEEMAEQLKAGEQNDR